MVNLTKVFETTKHLIDGGDIVAELRPYLGMSQLGHSCPRFLWYQFRWAYQDRYSKRLARLFARGHREEPILDQLLRDIGYEVDSEAAQEEMVTGFGHIKGHCDGKVKGVIEAPKTTHLLEYKTASDAKFKQYKKANDLSKSNPVYYAQTQLYMHFLKLTRCLWICVNKNDDDIHIERIRYNKAEAMDLIRKGEHILLSAEPPRQPFVRTYYECKWCSAKEVCWNGQPMQRNCRTCRHVELEHEGKWACGLNGGTIPLDFQRKGCEEYDAI